MHNLTFRVPLTHFLSIMNLHTMHYITHKLISSVSQHSRAMENANSTFDTFYTGMSTA